MHGNSNHWNTQYPLSRELSWNEQCIMSIHHWLHTTCVNEGWKEMNKSLIFRPFPIYILVLELYHR